MGKKKKQPQQGRQLTPWDLLQAMEQTVREPTAAEFAARMDRLAEMIQDEPDVLTVRRVAATRSICHCPGRDEVVVVTASARRRQRALAAAKKHGTDPVRSIVVYAVSAHQGSASPVEIDIEDAKRLVNALSEAIAETEFITAEA